MGCQDSSIASRTELYDVLVNLPAREITVAPHAKGKLIVKCLILFKKLPKAVIFTFPILRPIIVPFTVFQILIIKFFIMYYEQ